MTVTSEHSTTSTCKRATTGLGRLTSGDQFFLSLAITGSKTGEDAGFINSVRDLHKHIATFAAKHEVTQVTAFLGHNVMSDAEYTLEFNVSQVFTLKKERTY